MPRSELDVCEGDSDFDEQRLSLDSRPVAWLYSLTHQIHSFLDNGRIIYERALMIRDVEASLFFYIFGVRRRRDSRNIQRYWPLRRLIWLVEPIWEDSRRAMVRNRSHEWILVDWENARDAYFAMFLIDIIISLPMAARTQTRASSPLSTFSRISFSKSGSSGFKSSRVSPLSSINEQ